MKIVFIVFFVGGAIVVAIAFLLAVFETLRFSDDEEKYDEQMKGKDWDLRQSGYKK